MKLGLGDVETRGLGERNSLQASRNNETEKRGRGGLGRRGRLGWRRWRDELPEPVEGLSNYVQFSVPEPVEGESGRMRLLINLGLNMNRRSAKLIPRVNETLTTAVRGRMLKIGIGPFRTEGMPGWKRERKHLKLNHCNNDSFPMLFNYF